MMSFWPATLLFAVCLASAADATLEDDVRNGSSPAVAILKRLKRSTCRVTEMNWHVEGLREITSEAYSSGKANKYSGQFVLNGYNAKLNVKVERYEGELWLGLYFGLCKGPTDEFLAWPFRTPYTLTLLHPTNKTLDISNTISEFLPVTYKNFQRPTDGCNNLWGFPEVTQVSEAEKGGYVVNNAISVGVKLNL
ncbi:TNF receptor-associated factor 2-like [Ornithodoros turicata]|uniref:TNF receptor-associated factor 2-like n=1 Tax=Ornithodoros turicata TaxID=34597 RepID=UPI0031392387